MLHKSIPGIVGILALCSVFPVHADSVDDYLRTELERKRVPGLAVVVTRSGKIVKVAGYGYANLEHQVPVKPGTVFQSGSISKQVAAAVAMLLVEDGKIVLDDPVKKYLPDAPSAWDRITIRHLLMHTSGIPEYEYGKDFDMRKDYTDDERLRIVYGMKLEFAPGSRWNYSDTGYMVLGILLSRAGGEFYGDILRRRVFEPLGMKTAQIISEEDVIPNRASGYRLVRDEIKNQKFLSPSNYKTADGSLCWSVLDMAKWTDAGRTQALLKPDSWREMTTAVRLTSGRAYPYGFGWFIDEWNGKPVLQQGGNSPRQDRSRHHDHLRARACTQRKTDRGQGAGDDRASSELPRPRRGRQVKRVGFYFLTGWISPRAGGQVRRASRASRRIEIPCSAGAP